MTVVKKVKKYQVAARACEYCWSHTRGHFSIVGFVCSIWPRSVVCHGAADLREENRARVMDSQA